MPLLLLVLGGCPHPAPVGAVAPGAAAVAPGELDPAVRAALEAGAADTDVAVRRTALGALVRVAPCDSPWGPRGRFDPSEYVKRAVVDALSAHATDPACTTLLWTLAEAPDVPAWTRAYAAVPLAERRDPGDHDRLVALARANPVPGAQLAAALAGDPDALARLRASLEEGDLPMELWFFEAIGRSGLADLAPALTTAADRVEPEARLAVLAALLGLDPGAARGPLEQALHADEDGALEAIDYLRVMTSPVAAELLQHAEAGGAGIAKDVARMALVGLGVRDLRVAEDGLASEEGEVRRAAALAIARRLRTDPAAKGAAKAHAALRDHVKTDDAALQLAVIDGLGAAPEDADRAALMGLLKDESGLVRVTAAGELAK